MLFVICSTTGSYLFFKLSCLDIALMSGRAYLCPKPASGYCSVTGMVSVSEADNSSSDCRLLALVEKDRVPGGLEFLEDPGVFISSFIA